MLTSDQLDESTRRDFENPYLAGYGYGLGFRVLKRQAGGFHNGHPGAFGWTGGTGTWVEADPITGISIAYMHNITTIACVMWYMDVYKKEKGRN